MLHIHLVEVGILAAIVRNLAAEAVVRSLVEAVVRNLVEAVVHSHVEAVVRNPVVVDHSLAVAAVEDRGNAAHILVAVVAHTVAADHTPAVAAEEDTWYADHTLRAHHIGPGELRKALRAVGKTFRLSGHRTSRLHQEAFSIPK